MMVDLRGRILVLMVFTNLMLVTGSAVPAAAPARSSPQSYFVEAAQAGIQNDMLLALLASLLAVGLIVAGLIWLARHRTRSHIVSPRVNVSITGARDFSRQPMGPRS